MEPSASQSRAANLDAELAELLPPGQPAAQSKASQRWPGKIPGEVGIWVFILGDMMVFGILFGAFLYERGPQVDVFNHSRESLSTTFGAVNTLLLLTSSVFVVMGVRALRGGLQLWAPRLFSLAFLCGLGFVFNKYLEYSEKLSSGLNPAENDFYMYFFILTGIHLLHLLIGMGVLAFMWRMARRPRPAERQIRAVESGASYWHLVDLLWVVLFPLLYLAS